MRAPRLDSATWAAFALVTALALADIVTGHHSVLLSFVLIGPFVASAYATPAQTTAVSAYAVLASVLLGIPNDISGTLDHLLRSALVTCGGVIATWLAVRRQRREEELTRVRNVAVVAQEAVLRPMPPVVGPVALAARYLSAQREASVGGDLYEAVATRRGVRVVVGDVRGKGLDAVRLASVVLGAFREAAAREDHLADVAIAMDASATRHLGAEDFVTAVLVEFDGLAGLQVVNCGHPPPVLVREGGLVTLTPPQVSPPLGMGPVPPVLHARLEPADRVLLYTDGLVEARSSEGSFFELADAHQCLLGRSLEESLKVLVDRLRKHVGGPLNDDLCLVLAAVGMASPAPCHHTGATRLSGAAAG